MTTPTSTPAAAPLASSVPASSTARSRSSPAAAPASASASRHRSATLGAHVVIASRKPEHVDARRREIRAAGGKATAWRVDVREPERVQQMVGRGGGRSTAASTCS